MLGPRGRSPSMEAESQRRAASAFLNKLARSSECLPLRKPGAASFAAFAAGPTSGDCRTLPESLLRTRVGAADSGSPPPPTPGLILKLAHELGISTNSQRSLIGPTQRLKIFFKRSKLHTLCGASSSCSPSRALVPTPPRSEYKAHLISRQLPSFWQIRNTSRLADGCSTNAELPYLESP